MLFRSAELRHPEALLAELGQRLGECQQLGLLQDPAVTAFQLSLAAAKPKAGKARGKGAAAQADQAEADQAQRMEPEADEAELDEAEA